MKPFRVLAVPQIIPAETKTMPEWVTVLADNEREVKMLNLKRAAQIIMCLIFASNVAFAAMKHGETGFINFPFTFMVNRCV